MTTYTFTFLNDPSEAISGGYTSAQGINDSGQITGYYLNNSGGTVGFLYSGGGYTNIADPSAGAPGTLAYGINNASQIVGWYDTNGAAEPGFLYSGGSYTNIVDPSAGGSTHAQGINNAGQIVGWYGTPGLNTQTYGFLYNNGAYTTLDDPLSNFVLSGVTFTKGTYAQSINDKGQIVGYYLGADGSNNHGFLYSGGTYTTLDDPSAGFLGTVAQGINDAGQIVGYYYDNSGKHGFLYSGGTYTTIDENPEFGATTTLSGINDAGMIVGSGPLGSFVATTTAANAINDSITELYIGYYNRAPDPAGENYWVGQSQGGMSLSAIAQSFSVQTESTNLYPFLASPNTASTAAVQAFVTSVYENLFNRAPDPTGEAYWVSQLQTGASTVGGAIINIISGAQLNDLATINNKVTVGDYFDTQIFTHNVQFSASVALAAFNAVTFNTSSIATAEAIVNVYVATAPLASQSATASQAEVNVVGVSPSHDLAVAA